MQTKLTDWTPVAAARFFGDGGGEAPVQHRVWSLRRRAKSGELEVLVPALAVMRALLRPHAYVLSEIFQPHALDLVCSFIDGAPRPTKPWPRARTSVESQPFVGAMTWMHCFPSARHAASSVYDRAREGWLDLELPEADVELYVSGAMREGTFFATQLSFSRIETGEDPFPFAVGTSGNFDLRPESRMPAPPKIGLRDGDYRLSEAEWAAVAFIVKGPHARRHEPRDVLDAALAVICGAACSLSAQIPDESMRRVFANQVSYWRENGKLAEVEAVLQRMRAGTAVGRDVPGAPWNPRRTVATDLAIGHFEPLNDAEWEAVEPLFGVRRTKRADQANETRDVADRIIAALAPGGSWGKTGRYSLGHAAGARYRLLVKDGRWQEVERVLQRLRPVAST